MTSPAGLLISPIVPLTILVTPEKLKFKKNPTFENMRNHLGGDLLLLRCLYIIDLLLHALYDNR